MNRKTYTNKIFIGFGEVYKVRRNNFWVNVYIDKVPKSVSLQDVKTFIYYWIVDTYKSCNFSDTTSKKIEYLKISESAVKEDPKTFVEGFAERIAFLNKLVDYLLLGKRGSDRFYIEMGL